MRLSFSRVFKLFRRPCFAMSELVHNAWCKMTSGFHRKPKETPSKCLVGSTPAPLLKIRPRALTLPEDPSPRSTDLQPQSSPFLRLPYDIRRQIYEEVLGGHLIHIIRKVDRLAIHRAERLAYVECIVLDVYPTDTRAYCVNINTLHNGCWDSQDAGMFGSYLERGWRPREGRVLCLLKTCRQVYVALPATDCLPNRI